LTAPVVALALASQVEGLLARARGAAPAIALASTAAKDAFVAATADLIEVRADAIRAANAADLAAASDRGDAFVDRLRLDAPRLAALAASTREIVLLPDPVGAITRTVVRPNGLVVARERVPLGVIGIIYEARPNVTVDAAVLCVKAGNCAILRGGSEAYHTNLALGAVLRDALAGAGLPPDAIQLPATTDRALVDALVGRAGGLDLCIPRGGSALIAAVSAAARVPVVQHYQGVCHVYVDAAADLEMAEAIVCNAKAQRPGVCNAMEALLVDAAIAPTAVPRLCRALAALGVAIAACPRARALAPDCTVDATEADFGREYLSLACLCAVVDGVDGAIAHIRRHGSRHTEAIVTADAAIARRFVAAVDASCAIVNASTRFNDGGCLGLGAEIGISTTKLHAYGPMGLEALTAERFVVHGQGQVRT